MAATSANGTGDRKRRGRGRRRRGRYSSMSEINVTPFVDVMLVLLIIFMVSAPLLTVGVPVQLPETAAEVLPVDNEEPLTVTLTVEGQIFIQESETPPDELIGKLSAVLAERSSDRLFLRADGSLPYDHVMRVMGALNAGGFRSIGLVTDTGGISLEEEDG